MSLAQTKRSVNGILLLEKPVGLSSNQALQRVKRLFSARKAGHTGSLDPLAGGLLPICFGEATKFSQFVLEADKSYLVVMELGTRTASGDAEGEIIKQQAVPNFSRADIENALLEFKGQIEQIPSMFSAIKQNGQPLYRLARQGITVERKSRLINIYEINLIDFSKNSVRFEMKCSKGTYVRTLVDDVGEKLGCGAFVKQLYRLSVGPYQGMELVSLANLESEYGVGGLAAMDQYLLPVQTAVNHLPAVQLTSTMAIYMRQGHSILIPQTPLSGLVQLLTKEGQFIGVGEVLDNGKVAPSRMTQKL